MRLHCYTAESQRHVLAVTLLYCRVTEACPCGYTVILQSHRGMSLRLHCYTAESQRHVLAVTLLYCRVTEACPCGYTVILQSHRVMSFRLHCYTAESQRHVLAVTLLYCRVTEACPCGYTVILQSHRLKDVFHTNIIMVRKASFCTSGVFHKTTEHYYFQSWKLAHERNANFTKITDFILHSNTTASKKSKLYNNKHKYRKQIL